MIMRESKQKKGEKGARRKAELRGEKSVERKKGQKKLS